jgi:23S rRNA pseudouridine1911/1915/1917 synthase
VSKFVVPKAFSGAPVDRALRALAADAEAGTPSWNRVRRWLETGKVQVDSKLVLDPTTPVREGQTLELVMHARAPGAEPLPDAAIVFLDSQVVVVEKPAGINSVPFDRTERNALSQVLEKKLSAKSGRRHAPLQIVHRLDRDTTGLLMYARTLNAMRMLKDQFRRHSVERRYWAIVEGSLESRTITSRLAEDRGDGRRGSITNPTLGRVATTHVKVLERFARATLVECKLETGRTHQIRIHLGEAGHPLLGERIYRPKQSAPGFPAPRVMLHAFELGFVHPEDQRELFFSSEMPEDMRRVLAELGRAQAAPESPPRPSSPPRRTRRGL